MPVIDPADYRPKTTIYNHPSWRYRAAPGVSSSQLKTFVNQSPRHYQYGYGQPRPERAPSDAMRLGSLVHSLVLEPDTVDHEYEQQLCPQDYPGALFTLNDLKGYCRDHQLLVSGNKEELVGRVRLHDSEVPVWDVLVSEQRASRRQVIKPEMWETALRMRDGVFANPDARDLLSRGDPEVSVWAEHDGGQLVKCRCDWLRPDDGICVDLKTCACASPAAFARDCAKFGYGLQEAHYRDVLGQADYSLDEFVFIAVESEPPYLCQVYLLDEYSRRLSRQRHRLAMEQLSACQQLNQWPGYCEPSHELSLPGWYLKQLENAL